MIKIIELKCWPVYYDAIECDEKPFDLRLNDRNYRVGDVLLLRRYDNEHGIYTGKEMYKEITYILEQWEGLQPGYVILGLSRDADESVLARMPKLVHAKALASQQLRNGEQISWSLGFTVSNPTKTQILAWFPNAPKDKRHADLVEWLAGHALDLERERETRNLFP